MRTTIKYIKVHNQNKKTTIKNDKKKLLNFQKRKQNNINEHKTN